MRAARLIALLALAGLLAGACAPARVTPPGAQPSPAAADPSAQTCEERARDDERTAILRAGINTGLLAAAWGVLSGGAQGAFWGAVSGTRDGAWIGAAVGAGVGLVLGVVHGVDAARHAGSRLAGAPPPCPPEAVAAITPPPPVEPDLEDDFPTP